MQGGIDDSRRSIRMFLPGDPAGPPIRRNAMQTESKESNLSTILWTAGALAVVVVLAVYMGMS